MQNHLGLSGAHTLPLGLSGAQILPLGLSGAHTESSGSFRGTDIISGAQTLL